MPLRTGQTKQAIKTNIRTMKREGKPLKQAIAIAMAKAGKRKRKEKQYGTD